MKYTYIAVQRKIETGFYAYWIRVSTSDNLVSKMEPFIAANICETKTKAIRVSNFWNNCFQENGTYAFTYENETDDDAVLPF